MCMSKALFKWKLEYLHNDKKLRNMELCLSNMYKLLSIAFFTFFGYIYTQFKMSNDSETLMRTNTLFSFAPTPTLLYIKAGFSLS